MDLIEKTRNLKRHPWELSRSQNILKLLHNNNKTAVYADIGAGDRYFTLQLSSRTNGKIFAVDSEYTKKHSIENGINCLNDIAYLKNNSIDCLIMMDVLEHIENEDIFLETLLEKLKPGGEIIITVPAFEFLFSSHDVFLKHFRRYSRMQLIQILMKHDITVVNCFYFYTSLFLVRCISLLYDKVRLNKNKKKVGIGMWNYDENSYITRMILFMLNIDFSINKFSNKFYLHLPGLSILAVCRKK